MATTILKLQECTHLLDITNKQLRVKMELLADDDAQLILLKKQIADNEAIIANKNQEIKELNKLLKKEVRRKKFWKFATCATAVVSGILIVVLAIR